MSRAKQPWPTWAPGALLALLVIAAYLPAFTAGYVIDDDGYVYENASVRDSDGLVEIWLEPDLSPQYYPLVFTTFWIEYRLWGDAPMGYHVNNVLLHALNTWLLWLLLRRLSVPGAWLAAAIFGLHPVHVESVAWVAERKNVLSGAFYLISMLAFTRFYGLGATTGSAERRWVAYGVGLAAFAAAMLSKTAVLSLPAALVLVLWWKRERVDPWRDLAPLAPMFLLGLGLGMLTIHLETTKGGASGALWDLSWVERSLVAGRALWFYAAKLAWPAGLSFNYARWTVDASAAWQYVFPAAAAAAVIALWGLRRRIGRGPLAGVLFFAGTLAPTLGFFNVYFFRYAWVADHFQYLASIGLIAVVVGTVSRAVRRGPVIALRPGGAAAAVVLVVLAAQTATLCRRYENLETLCRSVLQTNPTSWLANNNLGNIHLQRGELDRAVERFEIALGSGPDYVETHLDLAIALMNLGRYDEARRHARRAIELEPDLPYGYLHLGEIELRDGRPDEALPWLERAFALGPGGVEAELNLASALARLDRNDAAVPHFESVLAREPDNVTAHVNLAICLVRLQRYPEAIAHLEQALRLDPGNEAIRRNLELARGSAAGSDPRNPQRLTRP